MDADLGGASDELGRGFADGRASKHAGWLHVA